VRKLVIVVCSALALAAVVAPPAIAQSTRPSKLSLTARITSFHATKKGVQAKGTLTGKLASGTGVSRDSAPVNFAVVTKAKNGRCNVLTLHLAPLDLELLGVQVQTSTINLNIYALHGQVLGNLFCALSRAKVTFPRAAAVARALNSRLHGRSLPVFTASQSVAASHSVSSSQWMRAAATGGPPSCQVLKLVLGPLNLNLLGLVVDLYGKTQTSPVIITINAIPSRGLLGQLLCGLAGGTGITSIGGLQSLLNSLGVSLSTAQIQSLLSQLGITNLSSGLTQLELQHILQALGLGSTTPGG
jgi:ribosomal protein L12E/L44/L45/RPP1/RPP2